MLRDRHQLRELVAREPDRRVGAVEHERELPGVHDDHPLDAVGNVAREVGRPVLLVRLQQVHQEGEVACRHGFAVGPLVRLERDRDPRVPLRVNRRLREARGLVQHRLAGLAVHVERPPHQALELLDVGHRVVRAVDDREDEVRCHSRTERERRRGAGAGASRGSACHAHDECGGRRNGQQRCRDSRRSAQAHASTVLSRHALCLHPGLLNV